MGGGGSKRTDKTTKSNEMSWSECYAIGKLMKAAQNNAEMQKNLINDPSKLVVIVNKIANVINQAMIPARNFVKVNILVPVTNLTNNVKQALKNITKPVIDVFNKLSSQLKENVQKLIDKFANISDKLVALFVGEDFDKKENILDKLKKIFVKKEKNPFEQLAESNNNGDGGSEGGLYYQEQESEEDADNI